jgi:SAM-dependent methyltransferase
VFDQYVMTAPDPQRTLDLFADEWSSRLPGEWGHLQAGTIPLFEDSRVAWGLDRLGGVAGRSVVELGPLEAGHTYMLAQRGARQVVAVEANTRAFLKCLVVKELLGLERVRFLLGDGLAFLRGTSERFDLCLASGILYHLHDPLELLQLIAARADAVFMWTHYHDPVIVARSSVFRGLFTGRQVVERDGLRVTYHRRVYPQASARMAGFSGGGQAYAHWLSRDDILGTLGRLGFGSIETAVEEPEHMNGPALALVARRSPGAGPAPAD